MKGLVALFFVALLGTGSSEVLEGCFDPPGDGPLANLIVDGLEAARPIMSEGMPGLGIPPLDPFGPIPLINFHIDLPKLRMDGFVNNTLVKNLAQYIICSVNISVGITQKFAFEFRLDNFHIEGEYDVDGLVSSLFPVFGSGDYRLDTYAAGFSGGAKVSYNVLTDHASIKDLTFDISFKTLELELECILGCGEMSDLINSVASDIGTAMKGLVALFFVALLGTGSPQVLEGCFDPPGDGPLADIIVDGLEAARPIMSEGVPELGIPPLDPFGPIPLIEFHIDVPQLRMDGYVDQTLVKNLAQYIICSVNVSLGITQKFAFEFRLDNFRMEGKYAVDGLIASLFPVFGDGDFSLDTYTTGFSGGAKISYNVLTDHASIKDLTFDIFFQTLNLELECILGCGDMADLINSVTDDIAPAIFDAVWGVLQPALAHALETAINEILKDINISDIISPPSEAP